MRLHVFSSHTSDNFFVLLEDGELAILIDPIDAAQADAQLKERGLRLEAILNTHWHPDHVGGNAELLAQWPEAKVYAGAVDADQIELITNHKVDVRLQADQQLKIGPFELTVLFTPGHTVGHISYRWHDHLFSGDVIFSGGAGNCRFGGDPGVLYQTFSQVLAALPEQVLVYPGHDYALKNLEMAHHLLPEDEAIAARLEHLRKEDTRTMSWFEPTSLGQERGFNLFMRVGEQALVSRLERDFGAELEAQRALSQSQDEAVWRTLRALRDRWQGPEQLFST